ncbi:MAG: hypothetical protein AUJ92_10160 [Armatimonadetes bacterium CG2_30_59_28]|nr:MAG: hypothetical protein AUJ92_10160 [Armatimonadetes bacterium CG2_30_59_28]
MAIVIAIVFLCVAAAILYWGQEGTRETLELYIPDPSSDALRSVPVSPQPSAQESADDQVLRVVTALLERSAKAPEGEKVAPAGTQLLSAIVAGDMVTLNFSSRIEDSAFWTGSNREYLSVYAIVSTATQFPGIDRVQFLVEGKELETLGGHIELTEPLTRDPALRDGVKKTEHR